MFLYGAEILSQARQRNIGPCWTRRRTDQDFCCGCHFRDYSGSSRRAEVTLGLLPPFMAPLRADSVSTQNEVHGDLCLHLNCLAVENVRTVAPLADSLNCGWNQHGMPGNQLQIFYRSILADFCC